ncbi:MAG: ATP phosphoribosyltransferase regulatory subunit [Leptolyngbya sp. SIO4C1]|nr:ATP phosphoribosyltransferase regulatory subunit [Leptolyngbya sp. SIO4C1]
MIYQPPTGARDLFPLDVAQKQWIEDRIEAVFRSWGYHRIITSTVEHMDTLMAGGAIQQTEVIELQSRWGERLGLRPELTASIARAAVARTDTVTYPQRLCYSANVFRHRATGSDDGQQEYYQTGVELIGASGLLADAEVLLLAASCLQALGLEQWHLILGEADLTRSLLLPFPKSVRSQVRQAIATLDRVSLETLPLPSELRDRALQLMDLRGEPKAVLSAVSKLDLEPPQLLTVGALKALIELLEALNQPDGPSLILDLSLIQPFDYYTGTVFEIVSRSTREVIGQGGRYDHLLSLYHPQGKGYPGVGFVLNVEALQQVLLPSAQLPSETPPSDWLVVATTPQAAAAAFAYAQKIRQSASIVRVELSLEMTQSPAALRQLARTRRISRIAWIRDDGLPEIEAVG